MGKKVRLFDAIENSLYDKELKIVEEPEETIKEQDEEPKVKKKKSSKNEPASVFSISSNSSICRRIS